MDPLIALNCHLAGLGVPNGLSAICNFSTQPTAIQNKYNTNTKQMLYKHICKYKMDFTPKNLSKMQRVNTFHRLTLHVHGGRATSFDEKGPNIGIHHPPLSIIINELREPLVVF